MQLHTVNQGEYTVVRPSVSRLDAAAAPELRNATADLANQGKFRVVLDLAGVDFVDSAGLGALIHLHKTLAPQGRLVLCNIAPKVAQLFKVTRLERVFSVAGSEAEAAQQIKR